MKLLLISNSTNAGEPYLDYPKKEIKSFLGNITEILFIPYAAVTFSYDQYLVKVQTRLAEVGLSVKSIHTSQNPIELVEKAKAIAVGGGNTFALLYYLQHHKLLEVIARKVRTGMPYIGWSAGSNVACPTIRTTNDMPIIEPQNLKALELVPFQINPHYLDHNPDGHAGETREQRIEEFMVLNKEIYVAGLREGCMLRYENEELRLIGPKSMRVFHAGIKTKECSSSDNLNFLMNK